MINVVIIEDNELFIKCLRNLINSHFQFIEIVGIAKNVIEGIKLIKKVNPDVIFLDINLPDGKGWDVIECLENTNYLTVIISSDKNYAYQAFKYQAFDFISKPINEEEFCQTMKNIVNCLKQKFEHLIIKTINGKKPIEQKNIMYIKGDGPYTQLFLIQDTASVIISKTLSKVEYLLDPNIFYRIHKSWIINKHYLLHYNNNRITMRNLRILPISRSKKEGFKNFITE